MPLFLLFAPLLFAPLLFAQPIPSAPLARTGTEVGVGVSPADGEYEVDYEEETEVGAEEEPPAPVKSRTVKRSRNKGTAGPAVQGSRAKNRFVPILKSDTRSVYQNKGKVYDVDTD